MCLRCGSVGTILRVPQAGVVGAVSSTLRIVANVRNVATCMRTIIAYRIVVGVRG